MESILITQNIDDLHCREISESKVLSKAKDPYRVVTDDTRESFSPFVYEIHGNTHYMHCSDESEEHSKKFYRCPSLEEFNAAFEASPEKEVTSEEGFTQSWCLVPRCEVCGAPMKPHSMFFDEIYSEHYYRKDTVMNFVEDADVLIVVGTALATNLAKQIVCKLINQELPVIEVNMESFINCGNNI